MRSLADASLDAKERRVLERLVQLLDERFGPELHAVWLYGSRARGERPHPDSDIDLLVVTSGGRAQDDSRVRDLLDEAARAEGVHSFVFSTQVLDPDWIENRRAIDSFFLREVDRDKILLGGNSADRILLEGKPWSPPDGAERGMSPRSEELLAAAREALVVAEAALALGAPSRAVSDGYYAMLSAARAALSEEDRFARTHKGTWHLFRETFVTTGRFDGALATKAEQAQPRREASDYKAERFSNEEGEGIVRDARAFLEAVSEMIS